MKTMKALKAHRYKGKLHSPGSEYPVARADIRMIEAVGWGKVVIPAEVPPVLPDRFFNYQTTALEAKPKRKYTRKKVVNVDRELIKADAMRAGLSEDEADAIAPIVIGDE